MYYITKLGLIKANPKAKLPTQKRDDAGFDLYSVENKTIPAGKVGKIDTGLQYAYTPIIPSDLDDNLVIPADIKDKRFSLLTKIEGRSGMASKGIFPVGGIIDRSYRGNWIVCLFNSTDQPYEVLEGDKIAQICLYPVLSNTPEHHVEFAWRSIQQNTGRSDKGFGSSGR